METSLPTFLQEAQETFEHILNERKAILRSEIKKDTVKEALERLFFRWKGLEVETLESRDYESVLEAQKIVLNLSLIYNSLLYEHESNQEAADAQEIAVGDSQVAAATEYDAVAEVIVTEEDAIIVSATDNITTTTTTTTNTTNTTDNTDNTNNIVNTTTTNYIVTTSATDNQENLDISVIILELERLINLFDKGPADDSEMIKSITLSRRLKLQIILLSFVCQSLTGEVPPKFEQMAVTFSREDIFAAFYKILPRAFNYNFYMKYYASFLETFVMSTKNGKLKHLMHSVLECFSKQFPQFPLSFEERHVTVMKKLGMESFNLEDCCDRIETRASVMSFESPIEMALKMLHLWLLIDSSEFLTFDDNFMAIYVFSSDLPVYHEQIMRIFYVLNRIDENVREIGYLAYSTPKFVSYYKTVYTEMHSLFSKLIRALSKNYEIYEMESDPISGAIKRKTKASAFIAAKLKELAIYLTCPMACLDSVLRLSLEISDIPILFGNEEEKFIFTTQVQSILVLHDFVASDREKFAEYTVELYPCLDRHFSRFHKSKKMESQGPNTALPPSYHLFASKPPTYENINEPSPNLDLEMQANAEVEDDCCTSCCKTILPAILFMSIILITIVYALYG